MSGEFANDFDNDDGILDDDEVPYDMHDLAEGYKEGWKEVASLTKECEGLANEVDRLTEVIAENQKVYMRAIEFVIATPMPWQHDGAPVKKGFYWVYFNDMELGIMLLWWEDGDWLEDADGNKPVGRPFCGPIAVPVYTKES